MMCPIGVDIHTHTHTLALRHTLKRLSSLKTLTDSMDNVYKDYVTIIQMHARTY